MLSGNINNIPSPIEREHNDFVRKEIEHELDISDDLKRILLKCIEIEPENRYQSVEEILDELERHIKKKNNQFQTSQLQNIQSSTTNTQGKENNVFEDNLSGLGMRLGGIVIFVMLKKHIYFFDSGFINFFIYIVIFILPFFIFLFIGRIIDVALESLFGINGYQKIIKNIEFISNLIIIIFGSLFLSFVSYIIVTDNLHWGKTEGVVIGVIVFITSIVFLKKETGI